MHTSPGCSKNSVTALRPGATPHAMPCLLHSLQADDKQAANTHWRTRRARCGRSQKQRLRECMRMSRFSCRNRQGLTAPAQLAFAASTPSAKAQLIGAGVSQPIILLVKRRAGKPLASRARASLRGMDASRTTHQQATMQHRLAPRRAQMMLRMLAQTQGPAWQMAPRQATRRAQALRSEGHRHQLAHPDPCPDPDQTRRLQQHLAACGR